MLNDVRLDPSIHDRDDFDCGIDALNDYLRRLAAQHWRKKISTTYVLVDSDQPHQILGYYSLSAAQVDVGELSQSEQKKLPRFPIPCFRMGRLACRSDRRGSGLGRLLIGCAVDRCLEVRQHIQAYALLVDAKDQAAKSFYEHYGFRRLRDHPMALYLPLGS